VARIDSFIDASAFHRAKAETIRAIAIRAAEEFDGKLPCDADVFSRQS
jgi:endonuclease III